MLNSHDYELIAQCIRTACLDDKALNSIVITMCRVFKQDNPNFKPAVFAKACQADVSVLFAI